MKISRSITIFSLLVPIFSLASQTLIGKVINKHTQQPMEMVAVYFDNTTIGTTTNSEGRFSLAYSDAVQSTLVISYLGYKKVLIDDYRAQNNIEVELVEAENALDEVFIEYDDGLTRRQKLRHFRKEFLGTSKFGRSCKIINEDDLVLRYDKHNKTLYASSKKPLDIVNRALNYHLTYDLIDFEISFGYANLKTMEFSVNSVSYLGTSFVALSDSDTKKTIKNRDKAYKGSVQHFMRALYNGTLIEDGYLFGQKRRIVNWYDFFSIADSSENGIKTIILKETLDIYYTIDIRSFIEPKVEEFKIDKYGNYSPVLGVYFGGFMGNQRAGDMLPLGYGM